jgi:hypothetical protein
MMSREDCGEQSGAGKNHPHTLGGGPLLPRLSGPRHGPLKTFRGLLWLLSAHQYASASA